MLRFSIFSLIFGDQVLSNKVRDNVVGTPANIGAIILELFVEHVEVLIYFGIVKGMDDRLIVIPIPFDLQLTLHFLKQITSSEKVSASYTFL